MKRQTHEETFTEVCAVVRIGEAAVQSRERTVDTVRRRAMVARMLCEHLGWPQKRTAKHLRRTVRQVHNLLRNVLVVSGSNRKQRE